MDPVQDLLVLGLQVEVLEGRRLLGKSESSSTIIIQKSDRFEIDLLLGRRRPTLGAGTPLQLTKDPQWGRHWEDQELPTLALDHPLVREVLSSQGRQGGLLGLEVLHLVGEDSHNLNRATGTRRKIVTYFQLMGLNFSFVYLMFVSQDQYLQWHKHVGGWASRCWGWWACRSWSRRSCKFLWVKVTMMKMMMWRRRKGN